MEKVIRAETPAVDPVAESSPLVEPTRRRGSAVVLNAAALPTTTAAYASAAVKLPPFKND